MSTTPPDKVRRSIWTRTSAIILLLAFCMGTVAGMAWVVLRQIDELSTANSDNLQWSLAQADVEVLQLELALRKAIADPAQLGEVRRRFDVFYSRIGTLERGDVFRTLRSAPDFSEPHGAVRAFLDDTVPMIALALRSGDLCPGVRQPALGDHRHSDPALDHPRRAAGRSVIADLFLSASLPHGGTPCPLGP